MTTENIQYFMNHIIDLLSSRVMIQRFKKQMSGLLVLLLALSPALSVQAQINMITNGLNKIGYDAAVTLTSQNDPMSIVEPLGTSDQFVNHAVMHTVPSNTACETSSVFCPKLVTPQYTQHNQDENSCDDDRGSCANHMNCCVLSFVLPAFSIPAMAHNSQLFLSSPNPAIYLLILPTDSKPPRL